MVDLELDEITEEIKGAAVHYCLRTSIPALSLEIVTTWWKPDQEKPDGWARSVVGSTDPRRILARFKDYRLPVTKGGLLEAHYYVVEEAKEGRYPAGGGGPVDW